MLIDHSNINQQLFPARMDTLHSIENLPFEQTETDELENEQPEPLNFRFMARNISVDWRSVSLIDIDRIAQTMDIPALQVGPFYILLRVYFQVYFNLFIYVIGAYRTRNICKNG